MSADKERERRAREFMEKHGRVRIPGTHDTYYIFPAEVADFAASETSALQAKLTAAEQQIEVDHNVMRIELGRRCDLNKDKCDICEQVESRRVLAGEKE